MQLFKKIIEISGSIKLTILCLVIFFILVIGGTFYQVDAGLLAAQKKIFGSWGFLLFNFLPFPGIKTVSVITLINLSISGYRYFSFRKSGILLMHVGIVVLLLGSAIASLFIKESVLSLFEGESAAFTRDYTKWKFIVSKGSLDNNTNTDTYDLSKLTNGQRINLTNTGLEIDLRTIYTNCDGLGYSPEKIDSLVPKTPARDMSGSFPGIILAIKRKNETECDSNRILLFGGNTTPAKFAIGSDTFYLKLQPLEIPLPFKIELSKFVKENHPGTTDARSFKSYIKVQGDGIDRDAVISMNRPFRYKSLTLYQNGFSKQDRGNMTSLLVVENPTRFVPYLSGILVMLGLFIHFISVFINSYKKMRSNANVK